MPRNTTSRAADLTIGRLSAASGCKIETIRFYERSRLLPAPSRTEGGHRIYAERHLRRLTFIRRARELGFTLDDVRALLALADREGGTCAEVRDVTLRHLLDVRAKLADLRRLDLSACWRRRSQAAKAATYATARSSTRYAARPSDLAAADRRDAVSPAAALERSLVGSASSEDLTMTVAGSNRPSGASRPVLRRDLLKGGGAAIGLAALAGCETATGINPLVPPAAKVIQDRSQVQPSAAAGSSVPTQQPADSKEKPTYVAQARDPVAYSLADNLFWNDIMMEHALFFVMLMPGPELDEPRRQAEEFQRLFAQQFDQSRGIDASNLVAFNQRSIDNAKRFSDWKRTMKERQESGKLQSLVWPLFFEHTAREADRFSQRLALYSRRQIEFDRAEVVGFWPRQMGEHAAFISHLLDPQERLLIDQAEKLHNALLNPSTLRGGGQTDPVMKAAEEILDFKTIGEKGIRSGAIKSIVRPELAAHVRREAVRFIDELKRTGPAVT